MRIKTLDQLKNEHIGEIGTKERDKYEFDLKLDILGEMIKKNTKRKTFNTRRIRKINWCSESSNF